MCHPYCFCKCVQADERKGVRGEIDEVVCAKSAQQIETMGDILTDARNGRF